MPIFAPQMRGFKFILLLVALSTMLGIPHSYATGKDGDAPQQSKKETREERKARKKRERNGGGENKSNTETAKPAGLATGKLPTKRKTDLAWPDSKIKKRYKVSVVVPLYLDELVRGESVTFRDKVPEKATAGLAFYQGVKLAADSLKRAGAKLDIYIHDAGSFKESPDMLITNRKLDSIDLIIGAVEQHDIPVLATYARKKKINFVSALTNYDGWVKDNQYFTMLQPSVKSHCEFIIDELSRRFSGQDVTLLYRTSSLADDNAALYMLNDLYSEVVFHKLQCNTLPSREVFATVMDTTKPGIIAIPILDPLYADSLLATLAKYFPTTHFEVFGMPTWNEIPALRKTGSYSNITVNVTHPFKFETGTDSVLLQRVKSNYRKEFGGNPSEMVMRGYETMLWYGTLLRRYGTLFNSEYSDISAAPFTKFRIKPRWDRNGSLLYLENRNIYMSTYQGGIYRTR